jgi:hypothetical protein
MIATGVLTAVCFIVIAAKLGPKILKRILGFEVYVDVASHFFFIWLGMGTFSGVMTGIISALFVSAVLRAAKNILGYTVIEDGEWVDKPGKWSIRYLTFKLVHGGTLLIATVVQEVRAGVQAANTAQELAVV